MADSGAAEDDDEAIVEGELVPPTSAVTSHVGPASSSPVGDANISVLVGIGTYASDLPPAAEVAQLEAILPGTLDRLLTLKESVAAQAATEQTHRHTLEDDDSRLRSRGQKIGAGAFVLGLAISLILALTGHDAAAAVIGGSTLLGVVVVFVTGRVIGQSDPEA